MGSRREGRNGHNILSDDKFIHLHSLPSLVWTMSILLIRCLPIPLNLCNWVTHVSLEENRCRRQNMCLYCGNKGHYAKSCPLRQDLPVRKGALVSRTSPPLSTYEGQLLLANQSFPLSIFIDSWADKRIMDNGLAMQLSLDRVPLDKPIEASALDSCQPGRVAHRTQPVS